MPIWRSRPTRPPWQPQPLRKPAPAQTGGGGGGGGTVTISTPAAYKVFQRSGGGTADIAITGTYTGTPAAIEASFNGGSYATIAASPAGGTYSGSLTGQAAGRGTLTVRFTDDTAVVATVGNVGVGDVFVVGGDSISEGRGTNAQSYSGSAKLSVFKESNVWADGNDPVDTGTSNGSHWPLLGTLLLAELSTVPVAFVTTGTGSTDVSGTHNEWAKNNSAYANMVSKVSAAATGANGVKGVLLHLGPNAEAEGISQATYKAALTQLASDIAADLAGAPKTAVVAYGTTNLDVRADIDAIRGAVKQFWDTDSNGRPGPVLIDQSYADGVHPSTDAQLLALARRWFVAVKEGFYSGGAGYGRGPRVSGSITLDPTKTLVTVNFDRDLASGTTYGGFRVTDSGVAQTITEARRVSARRIVITVSAAMSAIGNVAVSFGSADDASGQTVPTSTAITLPDSSTVALPAEMFAGAAVALEGSGGAVATVFRSAMIGG